MSNETNACAFVKDKVSLTEFIERHEEVKSGRAAHSVAHESVSKNALHIDESNGRFFCHSCGAKGSVIDYEISRIGGDPKNEEDVMRAVKSIAEQENLTLPEGGKPLTPEDKERIEKRREEKASVQGLLNASRDFYVSKLTPSRRESLTERGVKTKTITALQIGYAPYQQGEKTALVKHLSPLAHGDESLLLKTGLGRRWPPPFRPAIGRRLRSVLGAGGASRPARRAMPACSGAGAWRSPSTGGRTPTATGASSRWRAERWRRARAVGADSGDDRRRGSASGGSGGRGAMRARRGRRGRSAHRRGVIAGRSRAEADAPGAGRSRVRYPPRRRANGSITRRPS